MKYSIAQLCKLIGLTFEEKIVPPNNENVFDVDLEEWETTTLHETANEKVGANADMHNKFIRNGGGDENVSFTFVVDHIKCIQNLRLNQYNIAQGTRKGNLRSVSIEMCVNSDGHWPTTRKNTAKLLAVLAIYGKKPIETVVQHWVWYGKNCPSRLRANPADYKTLLMDAVAFTHQLTALIHVPAPVAAERIVLNGFTVTGGFLELWRKYGLDVMGFPQSEEYIEAVEIPGQGKVRVTFQDWENVVTEWREGVPARIGAGIRKYKYKK